MKGLNPQEVAGLLSYIQENNSWRHMHTLHQQGRVTPKYIDMSFDTRTGDMWRIVFRNCVGGKNIKSTKEYIFDTNSGYNLKEKVYNWLDGKEV